MQPVVEDLAQEENFLSSAIRTRQTDVHSWGVVPSNVYPAALNIPVSGTNAAPNLPYRNLEFPIALDTSSGQFSIGQGSGSIISGAPAVGGIAEDLLGERIAILADAAYDPSNSSPFGVKNSGNLNIPLASPSATPYYVWIEYLGVNLPQPVLDKNAVIHYPYIDDGYKIIITTTPVAPSGDGLSVFMFKIVWQTSAAGTLSLSKGTTTDVFGNSVTTATPEIARVYRLSRGNSVEAMPNINAFPSAYGYGVRTTLEEHVSAIGSGTPSPKNPHGITLADIEGGTLEPKAVANQAASLADGIIDFDQIPNSPVLPVTPLTPSINNSSLTPATSLDPAAIAQGVTTAVKDAWIRSKDLHSVSGALKTVYLSGRRIVSLYPNMRQTQDKQGDSSIIPGDPNSGDGWIGFKSNNGSGGPVDVTGLYQLVGSNAVIGGDEVLILSKQFLGTSWPTGGVPALPAGFLDMGIVYWYNPSPFNNGQLFRDNLQSSSGSDNTPIDRRSAGLIGPKQLSTDAKANPNLGVLSKVTFENLLANSNFAFDKTGSPLNFPGWNQPVGDTTLIPRTSIVQVNSGGVPTLVTGGAGAITGMQLTPAAAASGTTRLFGQLRNLKPDTVYAVSFWYLAAATWNVRLRVGINSANDGTGVSMLTTGSPSGSPVDFPLQNDGSLWHRGSLVFTTNSLVDPSSPYYLELNFTNPAGFPTSNSVALIITNILVAEGEWVMQYNNNRMVPQGASLFFSNSSACPSGYIEDTNMQGRLPMGYFPGGSSGAQTPGTNLGAQISNGTIHTSSNGTHNHTGTTAASGSSAQSGGGPADVSQVGHTHTMTTSSDGAHTHTLGIRVGIWCQAI
jgi:hypothetical protein